ncbi:MAG: hypothetical protein GY797_08040 [Deltaproteobacteria bacterium]|nr:hypothetical protein [Deltaproteobacteria bacterium]
MVATAGQIPGICAGILHNKGKVATGHRAAVVQLVGSQDKRFSTCPVHIIHSGKFKHIEAVGIGRRGCQARKVDVGVIVGQDTTIIPRWI